MKARDGFARMISGYLERDDATTAIEFGIIGSVFLTFIVGLYVVGLYFFTWNRLQYSAEIAARYAAIHDDATSNDLQEIIVDNMQIVSIDPANLNISISDSSSNGVDFRQVDASYTYAWNLPFIPADLNDVALSASSRMAVH